MFWKVAALRANDIHVVREAVKLENRKPVPKHNGLGALCLPLNERPSYLESVGLEIYYYLRPGIARVANGKKKCGLYIPPALANQLVIVDGIPGFKIWLKHRFETPKQDLAALYEGYRARRLI